MKISLVINTYNRMHTLPVTLESLEFLRYPELEVIVVDGPSTDGTLHYLNTNWSSKVKICTCPEANLSKSRNIGIKNASGDIVCFIDDDGIAEPDWLNQLIVAYEDPKVGAAGGWVRNHTGVQYQTKYIASSREAISEVLIETIDGMPESKPFANKFPGLIGVNSSFRRTALLEIGGFDTEYAYFLDETDVLVRLIDAGYQVKMISEAEVHHKYAKSHIRSQNGAARSWLQIMISTAYYIIRNAAPDTALSSCMETIAKHKRNRINDTNWFLSQKMIDSARHAELIAEIERGATKGISDAFEYPCRRLLNDHHESEWKSFPRRLNVDKRLRIAFVSALYPPRPCGGVAVFIYNLAKKLAEFGHEITIITQAETGRYHTVDFEDGIWVHRLPDDDTVAIDLPALMPDMPEQPKKMAGKVLAELNRVNNRRQFQYVIGAIWDLDLAAIIASQTYPTAMYLVTSFKLMEDFKPDWKENKSFYEKHVKKMIKAERWALENVNRILTSTSAILSDMESAYQLSIDKKKLALLPFGIPSPISSAVIEKKQKDEIQLLFVGRFEQRKGIDLILESLPYLLEQFKQLRIICIGDNSIPAAHGRPYLHDFLETYGTADWIDRVNFLGHVDDTTLEQAYANCDIFIAPSRYESFGLIYLEAMRFGKPCIGTIAGGIPEVVSDGETGILVPPGEAIALRLAIEKLIVDENLRVILGENGRRRYQEQFTMESFATRFEGLIYQWLEEETKMKQIPLATNSL